MKNESKLREISWDILDLQMTMFLMSQDTNELQIMLEELYSNNKQIGLNTNLKKIHIMLNALVDINEEILLLPCRKGKLIMFT